jgi:hypothetical protein
VAQDVGHEFKAQRAHTKMPRVIKRKKEKVVRVDSLVSFQISNPSYFLVRAAMAHSSVLRPQHLTLWMCGRRREN